jgi:hypothetical protein
MLALGITVIGIIIMQDILNTNVDFTFIIRENSKDASKWGKSPYPRWSST